MAYTKTLTGPTGTECSFHIIYAIDINISSMEGTITIGHYDSKESAYLLLTPDFKTQYGMIFTSFAESRIEAEAYLETLEEWAGIFVDLEEWKPVQATQALSQTQILTPPIIETLESVKTNKTIEMKAVRDAKEIGGFIYLDRPFDSDDKSMRRLSVAIDAARTALLQGQDFSIEWTCANDSLITLTAQDLIYMPIVMATRGNAIHQEYRRVKDEIDIAETIEDVKNITWNLT